MAYAAGIASVMSLTAMSRSACDKPQCRTEVRTGQAEQYLLGHSRSERERLCAQVEYFAQDARWLLAQLDIHRGARAIDLGCGPLGILDLLSNAVGPEGQVVGIEKNAAFCAYAREFAQERSLLNVDILQGDAGNTGLARESFDLAHARLVLCNVPEPERIVREMVALVRPGGAIASHEADYGPHVCDPPCPAWDRLFGIFEAYSRRNGIDLNVARRTHRLFRAASITDLQVKPLIHVYPQGHERRMIFWEFVQNVRAGMLAAGLVEEPELVELLDALRAHLEDPNTLLVSHLFIQLWGTKPIG